MDFRDGRVHGATHSALSAQIAEQLDVPDRIVRVIVKNDRAYSHWRKLLDKEGRWTATRWTNERRAAFAAEFSPDLVDLELLVVQGDGRERSFQLPGEEAGDHIRRMQRGAWVRNHLHPEAAAFLLPEIRGEELEVRVPRDVDRLQAFAWRRLLHRPDHVAQELLEDEATRRIPIIFLTARADVRDRARGLGAGGLDYITKPFNPVELADLVGDVVGAVQRGEREELRAEKLSELRDALGAA